MEYKGVTIRAEMTCYEIYSLNEDGQLSDWYAESDNSGYITGYFFEGNGINEFVCMSETDGKMLKDMVDDYLREQVLIGQDEQSDYAHCTACDKVISLDSESWQVISDETYCDNCADKEEAK